MEYALQAALLSARRASRLVESSDLLLHCNNAALSPTVLLRFLARYPHRLRALLQTMDNSQGYRCGHLHAIATTRSVWSAYANVLFLHPDVYLLPRAVDWLEGALNATDAASTAFFVTSMFWVDERGRAKTRPDESGRSPFYGTDLFAFRPPLLRRDAWKGICVVPPNAPPSHRLPEHALYGLVHSEPRVSSRVLGNRTTSTPSPLIGDAYGVWHSHEPERVAQYLQEHRLVPPNKGRTGGGG